MGNGRHAERVGTRTGQRPAAASPELPAALPDGHDGNRVRCSPSAWCADASLDAYIRELVDAAPPLTAEQRDTLALLLRHPRRG